MTDLGPRMHPSDVAAIGEAIERSVVDAMTDVDLLVAKSREASDPDRWLFERAALAHCRACGKSVLDEPITDLTYKFEVNGLMVTEVVWHDGCR